jgi:hypothetical protein
MKKDTISSVSNVCTLIHSQYCIEGNGSRVNGIEDVAMATAATTCELVINVGAGRGGAIKCQTK